ncbi:MAG: hypothetical protein [Wendovervirus sonii]|uniref:Uncharacterized protein n=1 Tax=phage Lak_Megaphage_Sonny TaxID=3109229 RepID=A0ABZ0Z2Y2_9CAUD|nr:MAG: hypothetical protein [phage Lak_Megaphage_Sonny]
MIKYHKKIWFDLEVYTYYSKCGSNLVDDTILLGSYCIDSTNVVNVSTKDIRDYIFKNSELFFDINSIKNLQICDMFRNVKSSHLIYQLQANSGKYIDAYMFITNIRVF